MNVGAISRPSVRARVDVLVLGAAGLVLAAVVGIAARAAIERSRIVRDGVRVEATVLELGEEKVGHERIRFLMKAAVMNGTLATLSIPHERFRTLQRGDRVTMAHPPAHPEQIILLHEDEAPAGPLRHPSVVRPGHGFRSLRR